MNSFSFELQPGTDVLVTEDEQQQGTYVVSVSTDSPYVMAGGFMVEATDIEEAAMMAERMLSESVTLPNARPTRDQLRALDDSMRAAIGRRVIASLRLV